MIIMIMIMMTELIFSDLFRLGELLFGGVNIYRYTGLLIVLPGFSVHNSTGYIFKPTSNKSIVINKNTQK